MTHRTMEQFYRELSEVMTNTFPDRDFSVDIGPNTLVFADLGMASIELVVLGERLEQFYGRKLPFGPFLSALREKGADDLALGELVSFLQQQV